MRRPTVSRSAALVGFVSLALIAVAFVTIGGRQPGLDVDGMNEEDATATRLVDAYRTGLALSGLANNAGLDTDARRWAEHLADSNTLSHDALSLEGWQSVGENVGRGATIEVIEQAFEDSPTHEHNLSGDYTHLGIAVAVRGEVTWIVQRFGRAQPSPTTAPAAVPTVTLAPVTVVTLVPPVLCQQAGG